MKKFLFLAAAALCAGAFIGACKSAPGSKNKRPIDPALFEQPQEAKKVSLAGSNFEGLKKTVWQLVEVQGGYASVVINRKLLLDAETGDFYTLQIIDEGISGRAAPNRYFAPFVPNTDVNGGAIAIRAIAGTLLSPLVNQTTALSEQEYYRILQGIKSWESTAADTLKLYSGDNYTLIFKRK